MCGTVTETMRNGALQTRPLVQVFNDECLFLCLITVTINLYKQLAFDIFPFQFSYLQKADRILHTQQ